jgi:hypothetical protein
LKAIRHITAKAAAAATATAGVAGRAMRQIKGTPPRVRPMKRLYITQRKLTTASRTVPASIRMAMEAAPTIVPSRMIDRARKRNVVTSAMDAMNPG